MLETEALSGANPAPPPLPPDASPLELKVQPDDAIFAPVNAPEKDSRASTSASHPFLRFVGRATLIAGLCAVAWAGGVYHASGHLPLGLMKWLPASGAQQSAERDKMLSTMQQMADDIRALKASVDGKDAARDAASESQTTALASVQAKSGATLADLAGRIDKLQAEVTSRLSQMNERLATITQQVSTPHAAAVAHTVAAHTEPRRKREHLHDAFDPSQQPMAIGAPRPLGAQ